MTPKLARLRKIISFLVSAGAIVAIFAAAALLGALVANATSPSPLQNGRLAFAGVSYDAGCWSKTVGIDDLGNAYARDVSVCE